MELSDFVRRLINTGTVSAKGTLATFLNDDLEATDAVLAEYYQNDVLEMPFTAPQFSPAAALWAARYVYTAIQLLVLRHTTEDVIKEKLIDYPGEINAESVYSADLILRYLPDLFNTAKGLAPSDVLVRILKKTAAQWPFSSVGIDLEESADRQIIFSHPSLKQEYTDRIIEKKDKSRANSDLVKTAILETLGGYSAELLPL